MREEAKPTVVNALLELGVQWGPGLMRRLWPRLLAEYGHAGVLDDLQERLAPSARLSQPFVESGDLTEYLLLMTPEQAAALEAAIGPLSAPAPNAETGERDLRPAGRRRVEALAEVCRRSSAVDADESGGRDGAAGTPAALHVMIPLADLEARTGCGEVMNHRDRHDPVAGGAAPGGLRRGPDSPRPRQCGEDLDLGRVVRLFTRAAAPTVAVRPGVHVPDALLPRPGPRPTTSCTGRMVACPTSTTPPCSARDITRSSTAAD